MTQLDFYRSIVKDLGVYSIFNSIREKLFYSMATVSRIPIRSKDLDDVLKEDTCISEEQVEFVKNSFGDNSKFRHYQISSDGLHIHYFVNCGDIPDESSPVALHLQHQYETVNNKISAASVIVLYEKHPRMTINLYKYPKIIKHELTHAAIEFVIHSNVALEQFYFDDNNSRFIEFICDVMPYLANPSKKENGINKYIDDSISCFGYDAEEDMGDLIKIVEEVSNDTQIMINDDSGDDMEE